MIRPVTVTRKSFLIDSLSMSTDSLQESVNNLVDGPGDHVTNAVGTIFRKVFVGSSHVGQEPCY